MLYRGGMSSSPSIPRPVQASVQHPSVQVPRLLSDLERLDARVTRYSRRARRTGEVRDFARWAHARASRWLVRRSLDAQLHQLAMTAAD